MIVHQLFPEPVYSSNLDRALTKKELKTINEYKKETYKNEGNTTSNDSYVLENKALKNLKKDLNKTVIDYFDKVICTSNSIIPHITQSWINYTETNQFHHRHFHSNSYVSGVFYIDAKKEVDSIIFYKPGEAQKTISLSVTRYNQFNSPSWRCSVQTGDVVLFPSSLHHGVNKKKGPDTRISLSFNVFFKGKIGDARGLTELTLG
jgi:uncharacterized protein (TIGR02466 family)